MTWNALADSKVNITAWHNNNGTVSVNVGTHQAILDEKQRIELGAYLISGTNHTVLARSRFVSLLDDEKWRACVEDAGVDNWEGFGYAMSQYHGDGEDDE